VTKKQAISKIMFALRKEDHFGLPYRGAVSVSADALRVALSALRAQAEAEKSEPLTAEELREMAGEPYWHVGLQETYPEAHWAILPTHVARCPQDYFYGKRWLGYRRKPEEGTK